MLLTVCIPSVAWGGDTWTDPYPGVRHLYRTTATPNRIHVLKVDLTRKDIRIRATRPADRGRVTSSFASAYGCEMAVNGDFYAAGYDPIGLAVGHWQQWDDGVDTGSHSFVAAGVDNRVEIPAVGDVVEPPADWISDAVGGNVMLVWDGGMIDNSGCGSFCNRHPRTAAGITEDGNTLILAIIDGRSTVSAGATLNELGALMLEMGSWRALNLDGGGSTTMYIAGEGGVVNSPSDGSQRVVANHLGVCVVPPFGTLTGFVREGDIYDVDSPVSGATVTLSTGQTATTGADGRYTIEDVAAGDVTISATAPGFATSERALYVAADDTTWGSMALVTAPDAGPIDTTPDAGGDPGDPDAGAAGGGDAGDDGTGGGGVSGCSAAGGTGGLGALIPLLFALALVAGRRRALLAVLAALAAGGCSAEEGPDVDWIGQEAVVGDYYSSTCSTSVVLGLSLQIADEVRCVAPGTLVPFEERDGIVFAGSAVVPYLAQDARDDLYAAAASYGGELRVNSAFRTVVQQFLLYKWYQLGRCGITAAATPGRSNHESGRAIDFGNYGELASVLPAYGWAQTVLPNDPVHFDHLDSPDLRGYDVLAFQRLWNRNHPGDPIDEDGLWGPQTEARMAISPPDGFPIGGGCDDPERDAEYLATDAPERLREGGRQVVWVELRNTGTEAWQPGATFLGTTGPIDRDSALFDADSWIGPNRPATVDAATAPGEVGRFTFTIAAPEVDADTMLNETFGLVEEGVAWFGPDDVSVAVLVIDGAGDDSGDDPFDPNDPFDPGGGGDEEGEPLVVGGCAAGGPVSTGWPLALLALVALSRRSRRTRR